MSFNLTPTFRPPCSKQLNEESKSRIGLLSLNYKCHFEKPVNNGGNNNNNKRHVDFIEQSYIDFDESSNQLMSNSNGATKRSATTSRNIQQNTNAGLSLFDGAIIHDAMNEMSKNSTCNSESAMLKNSILKSKSQTKQSISQEESTTSSTVQIPKAPVLASIVEPALSLKDLLGTTSSMTTVSRPTAPASCGGRSGGRFNKYAAKTNLSNIKSASAANKTGSIQNSNKSGTTASVPITQFLDSAISAEAGNKIDYTSLNASAITASISMTANSSNTTTENTAPGTGKQLRFQSHSGNKLQFLFDGSDFSNLSSVCRNIAASPISVAHFYRKCGVCMDNNDSGSNSASGSHLIVSLVWRNLSTNHSKGLLNDKTKARVSNFIHTCSGNSNGSAGGRDIDQNWKTSGCDILGLLVVISSEIHVVYFLPLAECVGDPSYGADKTPGANPHQLPIQCGVKLKERWEIVQKLLFHNTGAINQCSPGASNMKIVFNTQVVLLSLLAHSDYYYKYCCSCNCQDRKLGGGEGLFHYDNGDYAHSVCFDRLNGYPTVTRFLPFDPKIAAYICDCNILGNTDSGINQSELELEALCQRYGIPQSAIPESNASSHLGIGRVSKVIMDTHRDMVRCLQLSVKIQAELSSMGCHDIVYNTVEMPLVEVLCIAELKGIVVDVSRVSDLQSRINKGIDRVSMYAWKCVDESIRNMMKQAPERAIPVYNRQFNLASPDQLSHILYNVLKCPPPASSYNATTTTATGRPKQISTAEDDLIKIRHAHPLVEYILQFRGLSKVSNTYIDGIRPFVLLSCNAGVGGPHTGTIHPNWNLTAVRTGRLSCSKPNMQNIPNSQTISITDYRMLHEEESDASAAITPDPPLVMEINPRECFRPNSFPRAKGRSILISADYSQIEMRILAHVSNDTRLVELFRRGGDIYNHLACSIVNADNRIDRNDSSDVSKENRNRAKVVTLGVMYGMGVQAAAAKLNVDVKTVNRITESFFTKFHGVKQWMQNVKSQAKRCGYVSTVLGRRRYLPELHGSNTFAQSTAERQAINTVIQGSASEVMKVAMLLIIEDIKVHPLFNAGATGDHASTKYMNIKNTYPRPQLIMQIHDELIFELYLEPHGSCGQNRHADMDFPSESCSDASSMHRDKYVIDCFIELLRYNMEVKVQHLFNMIHMNNPNMSCHFDNISKGSAPMGLSTPSSEVPLSHVPLLINIQISDDSWGKFEIYN